MKASARICALLWLGLIACDSTREDSPTSTTGEGSTTNDNPNTTIPVTSVSATISTSASDTTDGTDTDPDTSSTSGGDTDSTSSGVASGSTSTGDASGSSSTSGSSSSETTDGPELFTVGWCNLQYPSTIPEPGDMDPATTATVTTAYSRIYIEGLTDTNPTNDPHPQVMVEFGYGADGSLPSAGGWTWVAGAPNAGWDGDTVGQGNNDEYQGDIQFDAAGTYDFAARASGDGGASWVFCDLDGLVEGGYTVDQAGAAVIE